MVQKRTLTLEDDQRKEIVNELYGVLNDMTRNAPTSPAEGAGNEKVRTVISKILSMVETDEETKLREQSSQSSKGGLPDLNKRV
jgi:hypothetical protein